MMKLLKRLFLCSIGDHELKEYYIKPNDEGVSYFIYTCTNCPWKEVHRFPNSQTTIPLPGLKDLFDETH